MSDPNLPPLISPQNLTFLTLCMIWLRARNLITRARNLLQRYLAHPPRTLGIGLLQGPRGRRFLMGEVPLYPHKRTTPRENTPLGAASFSHG